MITKPIRLFMGRGSFETMPDVMDAKQLTKALQISKLFGSVGTDANLGCGMAETPYKQESTKTRPRAG